MIPVNSSTENLVKLQTEVYESDINLPKSPITLYYRFCTLNENTSMIVCICRSLSLSFLYQVVEPPTNFKKTVKIRR